MQSFLLVIQVLVSISLIALILMQHGKGADAGAAFGGGGSSTVFGASGSASFLSRATAVLATLFFAVSLSLAILAHRQSSEDSLVDKYKVTESAVTTEKMFDADVPVAPKAAMSESDIPTASMAESPVSSKENP